MWGELTAAVDDNWWWLFKTYTSITTIHPFTYGVEGNIDYDEWCEVPLLRVLLLFNTNEGDVHNFKRWTREDIACNILKSNEFNTILSIK